MTLTRPTTNWKEDDITIEARSGHPIKFLRKWPTDHAFVCPQRPQ